MKLSDYQTWTKSTAIYPAANTGELGELMYLALGLAGEAAEVANKVKKIYRDTQDDPNGPESQKRAQELKQGAIDELGDVMWYIARLASALGADAEDLLQKNHDKLESRKQRNVLTGSGDNR